MWAGHSQSQDQDAREASNSEHSASQTGQTQESSPENSASPRNSRRAEKPRLWPSGADPGARSENNSRDNPRSPRPDAFDNGQLSPAAVDRVFPIRSVVSVDPTSTPFHRHERPGEGYFGNASQARRQSLNASSDASFTNTPARARKSSAGSQTQGSDNGVADQARKISTSEASDKPSAAVRHTAQFYNELASTHTAGSDAGTTSTEARPGFMSRTTSMRSNKSHIDEDGAGLITARFKHVVSEGGHAVITGRDGDTIQRCEDEPIHIPGAVQGFGLLIALEEEIEGKLIVRVVSENSKRLLGYTPRQLFALESFTDILSQEQADNLLDHIDFIREEDADVATNGPEVFTMSVRSPNKRSQKLWCAMHINEHNPGLIICEFELEDDPVCPLVPPNDSTPEPPEDTLNSDPTPDEYAESTHNTSRPLRVLRSARKRKGEAAAMEVFNIMSQVQEQLASAPSLEKFLKILVGVVKELTGFHRVMVYQFDQSWNGRVVTELVDPRATKDLYKGLNFPASDIPKQARDLYKINKVRMLYDRDQETARLVCRTVEDLEKPLDLSFAYLRAMSPIHVKYLANMAVRSSMSISINAFEELWGLIACHSYGSKGMRVSFPIRKMCRLVGDTASRNIERLSYASRLQARKLINTVPSSGNPSGYIIASSEDLLKLFDADYGLLSIRDETKILGNIEQSQEGLAMLEYLRMRQITNVMTSQDISEDFPDLRYPPGFKVIAGLLLVPLSAGGRDFIVFFRKGQMREVKWAGNPYEKFIKAGTEGYLEPRKSFKTWSETIVGKCREWTEEEIETAAVLCLVYGKFIEVWRQKEAALQSSQLTRLLLANSAHEVRTPLNAIINYLEIALEGALDQETRENLARSHSASKSLIYVINDLLDLTKTEQGTDLVKDEVFDLKAALVEATDPFTGDARRKNITYEVVEQPGLPVRVIGDQRKIRQAISNITANAIQNTSNGGVTVEMYLVNEVDGKVDIEVSVEDTGVGIDAKRLDTLFRELEQVQSEGDLLGTGSSPGGKTIESSQPESGEAKRTLGLGLAVVARIIRNMNGQLRLKSEAGKGSRFVLQFPFELPSSSDTPKALPAAPSDREMETALPETMAVVTPPAQTGEVTLIDGGSGRRNSVGRRSSLTRKNSGDSVNSKRSLHSMMSGNSTFSQESGRSEADRLIEAISEPHMVAGSSSASDRAPSRSSLGSRPAVPHRHSTSGSFGNGGPAGSRSKSIEAARKPQQPRLVQVGPPGQVSVPDQRTPIKALRMQEGYEGPPSEGSEHMSVEAPPPVQGQVEEGNGSIDVPPSTDHMHVLVAEDDPVNSRIIKKRLEKIGHETTLTVNGEECSSAYGEHVGYFDVVLMDMQMPIVDGLTSTKMIRSFEKTHPSHILSSRASLNGRVPIIAVSASLEEKGRQVYIDAGFDGWILKPISFARLSEILMGIVNEKTRKDNLYRPGQWERGGWFSQAQKDVFTADTRPDGRLPMSGPSQGVIVAAASDDPFVKGEDDSVQSREQNRMGASQEKEKQIQATSEEQ